MEDIKKLIEDVMVNVSGQTPQQTIDQLQSLIVKINSASPPSMPDDNQIYAKVMEYEKEYDSQSGNWLYLTPADGHELCKWMRSQCEKDVEFSKYVKTAINLGGDYRAIVSDLLRKRNEIFNQQES